MLPFRLGVLACCASLAADPCASADWLEPVGIWSCLIYGHPRLGDEQQLLRFQPDGRTDVARPRADGFRVWVPISEWTVRRYRLSFSDPRMGRDFEGDLRRTTLGGTWIASVGTGGWWCASAAGSEDDFESLQRSGVDDLMPPLVGNVMMAPRYPRRAIREAKEGRAVACFIVDSGGRITEPELVELSDEIFADATMQAVQTSKYRGWEHAAVQRPGCRAFDYQLDTIR